MKIKLYSTQTHYLAWEVVEFYEPQEDPILEVLLSYRRIVPGIRYTLIFVLN